MGEKPNSKPNPISFGAPNPKTVGEKSYPNPNPQNLKPADIPPETEPLPSLVMIAHLMTSDVEEEDEQ